MGRQLDRPVRESWIVAALRTPFGRYGGALASVRPDDLVATVIRALVERSGIDPALIEDVILGCANQAGEDNRNVARMAALLAGLPVDGGVESMSRAPYVMLKPEAAYERGTHELADTTLGWRFVNPALAALHHPYSMGETGENVAERLGVSREEQDAFALASQRNAAAAIAAGHYRYQLVPIAIPRRKGEPIVVDADEHPRPDTTAEALARLKPAFREGGTGTAGNSSGIN